MLRGDKYLLRLVYVNLDSARQSQIEACVPIDEALPQEGRVRRRIDLAKSQQVQIHIDLAEEV